MLKKIRMHSKSPNSQILGLVTNGDVSGGGEPSTHHKTIKDSNQLPTPGVSAFNIYTYERGMSACL